MVTLSILLTSHHHSAIVREIHNHEYAPHAVGLMDKKILPKLDILAVDRGWLYRVNITMVKDEITGSSHALRTLNKWTSDVRGAHKSGLHWELSHRNIR